MLSDEGIQTLNFYSQQGYHLIREFPLEEKPTSREEFLEAFNIAMQLYEKQDSEVNWLRNTIDPSYTTIGMLFEKNFLFEVPKYQRYYSWEDEQVDDFIKDVKGI